MKPNVIFITCHDLGDYLGCYGTPVNTPNIDSIAKQGIQFNNHFSPATICSPSRGCVLTGCYPHTNGLMGLIHRGWNLNTKECKAMPQIFKEQGYETTLVGFQHEHNHPQELGYENIIKGKNFHCENVVPHFTKWLEERESDKPFYTAIGFMEVHRLANCSFEYENYNYTDSSKVQVKEYLPDTATVREDLSQFYGAIEYMDSYVGEILKAVEKKGIKNNTLIIFTTDHGASFYHSKATLYEGGTKVSLVACLEGVIPKNKKINNLTSHVDILPTLCELLNFNIPKQVQGQSQVSIIKGETSPREYVVSEENYNNHFVPGRAIRTKNFRYIKNGLPICLFDFLIPEIEQSTSNFKSNLDIFNFYSAKRVTEELYDIENDKGERVNLANHPNFKDILEYHRSLLKNHLKQTNDPFLNFKNDIIMPQDGYEILRDKLNN